MRPFLHMFPQIFRVDGVVIVAVNAPAAPPESEPAATPPREETRDERNARLDRMLAASREREERAQAVRAKRQRERLAAMRGVYGGRPR